jgi:hypothetical protein
MLSFALVLSEDLRERGRDLVAEGETPALRLSFIRAPIEAGAFTTSFYHFAEGLGHLGGELLANGSDGLYYLACGMIEFSVNVRDENEATCQWEAHIH